MSSKINLQTCEYARKSSIFQDNQLIWGKYRKTLFKTTLKLSFQFHHTQMDGAHAGRFLQRLQETIDSLKSGGY